jgi:hypothetical protein
MAQLIRIRTVLAAATLGLLLSVAPAARAQTMGQPEEFSAFAVNMGSYVVGTTANLVITVNRWSTPAERDTLLTLLREKGQQAFFEGVRDSRRVGSIRTTQSIGYELRVAIDEPGPDGGRRIFLFTDRPIGFLEATNRPHSIDYQLTVIEMSIGPNGKGEGTLSLAAKVIPAGKNLVIENYDTQPIRLTRVESRKLTK